MLRKLSILFLGLGFLLGIGALTQSLARPQIEDEEEVERKVDDEEEIPTKKKNYNPIEVDDPVEEKTDIDVKQITDLKRASKSEKHPGIKRMFRSLAVPFDLLKYQGLGRIKTQIVAPITRYIGDDPRRYKGTLKLTYLDQDFNKGKIYLRSTGDIIALNHYEEIAQKEVEKFLDEPYEKFRESDPRYLSKRDKLVACEQVLSVVRRFHQKARRDGIRDGDEWEAVGDKLRKSVLRLVIERLKMLVARSDWNAAFGLAKKTGERFERDKDQQEIAAPMDKLVQEVLDRGLGDEDNLRLAHARLQALQKEFPTARAFAPSISRLRKAAENNITRAKQIEKANPKEAANLLKRAYEIWPQLPGLKDRLLQAQKRYPVLNVGVKIPPLLYSPALASTDSEKQAVELLFESLVELGSDPGVVRYHPVLCKGRPRMIYLGRKFEILPNVRWSNGKPLTSLDVSGTLRILNDSGWRGYNPIRTRELLKETIVHDRSQLSLTLAQGFLDPLALMSFKILPNGVPSPDSLSFAKKPIGSGPFMYAGVGSDEGRQYTKFVANPYFGQRGIRKAQLGLPTIREIRFFVLQNPIEELQKRTVDLILDLSPGDLDRARTLQNVFVPDPLSSRRIHFLAINQRSPMLRNVELRRAIAAAIDREKLLDECYRSGHKDLHKPLNGPYPVDSWANNPKLKKQLHDITAAKEFLRQAKEKHATIGNKSWQVKYDRDDAQAAKALALISKQVKNVLGIELDPTPMQLSDLLSDVRDTHSYDFAYMSHDYRDHTYMLLELLDLKRTRKKEANYFGHLDGKMEQDLREALSHRNFTKVREITHDIHHRFQQTMPFVPLWQLDRLIAINRDLIISDGKNDVPYIRRGEPFPMDPLRIFATVEYWRLERK